VHDPRHWKQQAVSDALHEVLNFLMVIRWSIEFCKKKEIRKRTVPGSIHLPADLSAVILSAMAWIHTALPEFLGANGATS